jgi:hypothetical protein
MSHRTPTIAFESGWSDIWPMLYGDVQVWLEGGSPDVQLVILVLWSKEPGNLVRGSIEAYGRNAAGAPTLVQTEV